MQRISRANALALIADTRDSRHHVDPYVDGVVEEAKKIYRVKFQDSERFLGLIWPEAPGALLLTPPDESRTLREVANRIIYNSWTFEDLCQDMGLTPDLHDPDLFVKSRYLDEKFDYDKFGLLILAPPTEDEEELCPDGSFYIYDGFHRALVLAKRLLEEEVEYEQVTGILVIPRPLEESFQ
jgi:hypothetical protein